MVITPKIIKELEETYRKYFTEEFKRYLLVKYAEEPLPFEFSDQDLYTNIRHDIRDYEAGKLDITIKSPSERWLKERKYLQNLYIEKSREARDLEDYVAELEQILSEHGLESSRMSERKRIQF